MTSGFEWNQDKARTNLDKHGVSFEEAATVFDDPAYLTMDNPKHSDREARFLTLGYSSTQNLLVVCYTDRGDNIRIISARPATKQERRIYESEL